MKIKIKKKKITEKFSCNSSTEKNYIYKKKSENDSIEVVKKSQDNKKNLDYFVTSVKQGEFFFQKS